MSAATPIKGVSNDPGIPGVYGENTQAGDGVFGEGRDNGRGVVGVSTQHTAVEGNTVNGIAVFGAASPDGLGRGVVGKTTLATAVEGGSEQGVGVWGQSQGNPGVFGLRTGPGDPFIPVSRPESVPPEILAGAVWGRNDFPSQTGVHGTGSIGLIGEAHELGLLAYAVDNDGSIGAICIGRQAGLLARSLLNEGPALQAENPAGQAGLFKGDVMVTGQLQKLGGGFKIDHPADPGNRYLNHSFVESAERLNLYDGVTYCDSDGIAWVELAEWFEHLNENFRYQLTAIGAPAPNLHVATKLHGGRFQIAGGSPDLEVCWQITARRRDPWALAHPLTIEEAKPEADRGRYLDPTLYGAAEENGSVEGAKPHWERRGGD